jgi:hypothetical protein
MRVPPSTIPLSATPRSGGTPLSGFEGPRSGGAPRSGARSPASVPESTEGVEGGEVSDPQPSAAKASHSQRTFMETPIASEQAPGNWSAARRSPNDRMTDRPGWPNLPGVEVSADLHAIYREHFQYCYRTLRRLGGAGPGSTGRHPTTFLWWCTGACRTSSGGGRSNLGCLASPIGWRPTDSRRFFDPTGAARGRARAGGQQRQRPAPTGAGRSPNVWSSWPWRSWIWKKRAVFVAHELEGQAAPEIAAALGIPLNTVYSRLRVARDTFSKVVRRLAAKEPS